MQNKMVRSAEHAEEFLRKVRALVAQRTSDEIEQVQYNVVQHRTTMVQRIVMRSDRTDSHR